MTAKIYKGWHYSFGLSWGLYYKTNQISHKVIFTDSCRYNLNSVDQLDTNKLFGIGYFPTHHYNSVRFGWRYDLDKAQMEIMGYWYIKQQRFYQSLAFVQIGEQHTYTIDITPENHVLSMDSNNLLTIPLGGETLGYHLNPYFGGNQVAPHYMEILFDS